MNITRETLKNLTELQEDTAQYFIAENFPMSGELYWTVIESLATAKLAVLRGEVASDQSVPTSFHAPKMSRIMVEPS
jgi:hypothetical protein